MTKTNEPKPLVLIRFFSDTNFGLFVETLDYMIPGNYWKADYNKLTVSFFVIDENMERAKHSAEDLGAEVYE